MVPIRNLFEFACLWLIHLGVLAGFHSVTATTGYSTFPPWSVLICTAFGLTVGAVLARWIWESGTNLDGDNPDDTFEKDDPGDSADSKPSSQNS